MSQTETRNGVKAAAAAGTAGGAKAAAVPVRVINGPHVRTERTTRRVMLHVAISMVPALLGAVYFFGIRALYLTALSVAVCVMTEYLWQRLTKKQVTAGDLEIGSALGSIQLEDVWADSYTKAGIILHTSGQIQKR